MSVSPDDLANALSEALQDYSDDIDAGVKKAVNKAARETAQEIKKHITFKSRTGDYVSHFALKDTSKGARSHSKTWYVKAPEYRLTALLEKGHATPRKGSGKQTKAYPHIEYGEKIAQSRLPELIKDVVKNNG